MRGENEKFSIQSARSLFKALALVRNGVLLIITIVICSIIYMNFRSSIAKSLEQRSEIIVDKYRTDNTPDLDPNRVENGIHVETGMIYDENFDIVRRSCTSCHSSKLVIQNRATRQGWKQMIDWMQATQGLQDLGKYETKILDYLEKNYAPTEIGRRQNLKLEIEEWYALDLD